MNKNLHAPLIRILNEQDIEEFRNLRLLGLKESPEAFGADHEEFAAVPLEDLSRRLAGEDRFIMGAFEPDLVGIAGFYRRPGKKVRHTGEIWGVYVSPNSRGKRIARSLMEELIEKAKRCDGLERLVLTVVTRNKNAKKLYEALGFTLYGTDRNSLNVDGQRYDEDLMVLDFTRDS